MCCNVGYFDEYRRMVTLKDVAKEAGISVAATSMAIRDHRSISEETKRRVWDVQLRLGYSLRPRRNKKGPNDGNLLKNAAFVLIDRTFQDTAYSHIFQGIATASVEREVSPIYLSLRHEELADGQMPAVLRNRQVGGIIVSGNYDMQVHELFERLGLPLVVLGNYRLPGKSFASCESDIDQGIASMVSHFHELGHRRVGLIQNTKAIWYEQQILHYFQTEASRLHLEYAHQVISEAGSVALAMERLSSSPHRPTAILVTDEHALVEVQDAAARLGLEVPRDLSVGVLGVAEKSSSRPVFTSVAVDSQRLGKLALNKLIHQIENPEVIQSREIFPMKFIQGRSSAAPSV